MKISDAFPSNYIKCSDLQGRAHRVKMNFIKLEKLGDDEKPILYFIGKEKGLVLNKTNASVIATIYGDDTDNWAGCEIEIYPTETDFQGKRVDAIRVRMASRQVNQPPINPAASADFAPNARARAEDRQPPHIGPPPRTEDDFADSEIPF